VSILTGRAADHEMQIPMRNALVACVVLGLCLPIDGLITRKSKSDFNPTATWVCREPTAEDKKTMIDAGNTDFQFRADADPVGFGGGCMPDATCVAGKSSWTNVFG
jgi:hypothetical protein